MAQQWTHIPQTSAAQPGHSSPSANPLTASNGADADRALLDALDDQQREVAEQIGGPVAVIAGAGTGKTRTVTHRIVHAVLTGQQQASAILAVTFTTRAAGEMRARLKELGAPRVQARTFHSAALRQIKYFWPKVTGTELPQITDSVFGLVAEAAAREKIDADTALIRDLAGEISWAKSTNVTPTEYPRIANATRRHVGDLDSAVVARIAAEYERIKQRRGVMDYDDILLCDLALMHEYPEVAQEFHAWYQHFVVDEYQDVSPLQHALLTQWLGVGNDICVVGDPDQAIHSFAGADPRFLTGFSHEFPGATVLHLDQNYRSTPQILNAANTLLHPPGRKAVGHGVKLRARRSDGPEVTAYSAPTEEREAEQLAAWLVERHHAGMSWSQMAVLYRVNAQSPVFESALDDAAIPYQVRGVERFYERGEIKTALTRLNTASQHDPQAPAMEIFDAVLTELGWSLHAPKGQGRVRERWESWNALRDQAETYCDQGATTIRQLYDKLAERAALQQVPVADGVTLSTIHSAKGLEWDAVALVGVQEGLLPFALAQSPREIAEERRLFYVGLTRPREYLRLSWAVGSSQRKGTKTPSRFLGGIVDTGSQTTTPSNKPCRGRRVERCIVCGRALLSAVDIKLGHHEECAMAYDEELFDRLQQWRLLESRKAKVPAFIVLTDTTLVAIAQFLPRDERSLLRIRGIGRLKFDRYGAQILALVAGASPDEALEAGPTA